MSYSGPSLTRSEFEGQSETAITLTGTEIETVWADATVVHDSASILGAAAAIVTPTAGTTDGSSPASTGSGVTSAPTSTPTGTGTESVESSKSTGGMPQMTGGCGWAVGGMAAAVALAAL
jgi:hypothetical protein